MNPVSARLLNQQLASPQFSDPVSVVDHLGAVQAQDYRMVRWAVAMRTRRPSAKAFRTAFDSGEIVRVHLLRSTWQLICAENYWWMRDLCAPKGLVTLRGWMHSNGIDISEDEKMRIRDILLPAVSLARSVTKEDLDLCLKERGIVMDDHRLSYHIRLAEFDGVLCSGDLHPSKATYSLTETKLGAHVTLDHDEALARLARVYFRSHSPATLEDFVWWSGLGVGDCRKAVSLLGGEIHQQKCMGRDMLVLDSCRIRGFRKGEPLLLPPYDEYLIGYKSRDISLPQQFRERAHNNSGIFYPVIARDGVICGNWSPWKKTPEEEFFRPEDETDLSSEWSRYLKFRKSAQQL